LNLLKVDIGEQMAMTIDLAGATDKKQHGDAERNASGCAYDAGSRHCLPLNFTVTGTVCHFHPMMFHPTGQSYSLISVICVQFVCTCLNE